MPINNFHLRELDILRTTDPDIEDQGKEGIKYLCLFLDSVTRQPLDSTNGETLLNPPFAVNVFIETSFVVFNCSGQSKFWLGFVPFNLLPT